MLNLLKKIKLYFKNIFIIIIPSILFRVSANVGGVNVPNLNEDVVNIQQLNDDNISNFRDLARLQVGLENIKDLHEDRSVIQDMIEGYRQNYNTFERSAELLERRLNRSDADNKLLNQLVVDSESESNNSLSSVVGIFKFVKNNRDEILNNPGFNSVMDATNIQRVIKNGQGLTVNSEEVKTLLSSETVSQSSEVAGGFKPLGSLGDVTINQLFMSMINSSENIVNFLNKHPDVVQDFLNVGNVGLRILTPFLVFKGIMGIYNKTVPMPDLTRVRAEELKNVRRERLFFLLVAAPMLTYGLFNIAKVQLISHSVNKVEVVKNIISSDNKDTSSGLSSSLFSLLFRGSKKFSWKRLFLFLLLIIIVLILIIFKFNIIVDIFNVLNSSYFLHYYSILFILVNIIFIIRYIIFITLIYLIKNKKITTTIFIPPFFKKRFEMLKSFAQNEELELIIDYYYRLMFLYIILLFISIFFYFFFK